MIVNYVQSGWEVITQRNHALIAASIAAQWKFDKTPHRWLETIIAVAEHDDAFNEFLNDDVLNDNGGPINFNMRPFQKDFCDNLLFNALSKSRYIGLLVSYHIQFLYDKRSKEAHRYCEELKTLQQTWLKELDLTQGDAQKRYALLQWCDALSLIICQRQVPPEGRKMEIGEGPDGKRYAFHETVQQQLTVSPWPFASDHFSVTLESRTMERLLFENAASFHHAFKRATVVSQHIQFIKSDQTRETASPA